MAEWLAGAQREQRKPKSPELPAKTKEKKPRPPPTGRTALPKHLPVDAYRLEPDERAH
ncbi:MAG: hypothetical protein INH41_31005 [Myxococcaceae bacterium]|nr:hypothetical protein [Myxococcaceae bacterium]MCA3016836.1 hypothetical protein [Myxococcaceae bacterium]